MKQNIASTTKNFGAANQSNQPIIGTTTFSFLNTITSQLTKSPYSYTDKRNYQLKNNSNGKCLEGSKVGSQVLQKDCNPKNNKQLWKWRNNHICLEDGKCMVVETDKRNPSGVSHWEYYEGSKRQEWKFIDPGQLVSIGLCLGFRFSEDDLVEVQNCSDDKKGQIWSFVWL